MAERRIEIGKIVVVSILVTLVILFIKINVAEASNNPAAKTDRTASDEEGIDIGPYCEPPPGCYCILRPCGSWNCPPPNRCPGLLGVCCNATHAPPPN